MAARVTKKVEPTKKSDRTMGKEGMGGSGDLRDRSRDFYKPGANKPPAGWGNPVDQIKGLLKKRPKKKP